MGGDNDEVAHTEDKWNDTYHHHHKRYPPIFNRVELVGFALHATILTVGVIYVSIVLSTKPLRRHRRQWLCLAAVITMNLNTILLMTYNLGYRGSVPTWLNDEYQSFVFLPCYYACYDVIFSLMGATLIERIYSRYNAYYDGLTKTAATLIILGIIVLCAAWEAINIFLLHGGIECSPSYDAENPTRCHVNNYRRHHIIFYFVQGNILHLALVVVTGIGIYFHCRQTDGADVEIADVTMRLHEKGMGLVVGAAVVFVALHVAYWLSIMIEWHHIPVYPYQILIQDYIFRSNYIIVPVMWLRNYSVLLTPRMT